MNKYLFLFNVEEKSELQQKINKSILIFEKNKDTISNLAKENNKINITLEKVILNFIKGRR